MCRTAKRGGNDSDEVVIVQDPSIVRSSSSHRLSPSGHDDRVVHASSRNSNQGKLAILHGTGYANSPRSHFRSMDIWHTCEPDKVGTEGWLGRVAREFDPKKENAVTVVSFGPSLFRALSVRGVPVACVAGPLEKYWFLPTVQEREQRLKVLESFARMYKPVAGSGVMEYLGTTGLDSLKGADTLKVAPQRYESKVKYPETPIARKLRYMSTSGTPGYPKAGLLNHPTDVAVDTDGDIYVADLGQPSGVRLRLRRQPDRQSHRRCPGHVQVGPAEHRRQTPI